MYLLHTKSVLIPSISNSVYYNCVKCNKNIEPSITIKTAAIALRIFNNTTTNHSRAKFAVQLFQMDLKTKTNDSLRTCR